MPVPSWRDVTLAAAGAVLVMLTWTGDLHAQASSDVAVLDRQITELQNAGKYAAALPLVERLVALSRARHGEMSAQHATALERLAATYFFQSKYSEAEPIYQRVLAIREKVSGPGHASVLATLETLASVYRYGGRPQLAEPLLQRVLAERERSLGPHHGSVADTLRNLAEIEIASQRYDAAAAHARRALTVAEKARQGPTQIAQLVGTLAQIERSQGRIEEAERLLKQALTLHESMARSGRAESAAQMNHMMAVLQLSALYQQTDHYREAGLLAEQVLGMMEKLVGPDHPNVASQLEAVASMHGFQGRYAEAEALRKRALAINERAYGREHLNVALSLQGLGHLYRLQDRHEDALPLLSSALRIAEKSLGPQHPSLSLYLAEIGHLYQSKKLYDDAEPLLKRALANQDAAQGLDPLLSGVQKIQILQSLSFLYQSQGRHQDALPLIDRALNLSEQIFGPSHTMTGSMLGTLGMLHLDQDRTDEAERFFERASRIGEKAGLDGVGYADNIAGLSLVHFKREDWAKAYAAMKKASAIYVTLDQRATGGGSSVTSGTQRQTIPHADIFLLQTVAAYNLAEADPAAAGILRDEAFQMAQRAQSSQAATALGQMAARFSSDTGALADLVRLREDLAGEWQAQDARLLAALSGPPAQRNEKAEQTLRLRLEGIVARLSGLDTRIAREFPEYAALANPQPLSIVEAQRLLAPGEALVLIAGRLKQSMVWVIGKDTTRWKLVPLGEEELAREVAALRCGLDTAAWQGDAGPSCQSLLAVSDRSDGPLPFDLVRAHALYGALLAPFEDMIQGKHLLIAASGPLAALPFSVLVTDKSAVAVPPDPAQYGDAAWLSRRHAITVLPSVPSLASLRTVARPSIAQNSFIGFGNPLLSGTDGRDRSAWAKQQCPKDPLSPPQRVAARKMPGLPSNALRGTLVNTAALRRQSPLPETADELCAVARDLGTDEHNVMLGSGATESAIKTLNATGALATYRIVHFATHGLLAGETESFGSNAEPALLLTPPDASSDADDGLLTAGEITKLNLNADWVVLSACNTAAGGKAGGQPFSGLGRAFFYAGARALLVSHWYVDSDAAVKLMTKSFAEWRRDPAGGRAEAVRRAMLAVMADTSRPARSTPAAHPSVWAPFVVVGEGGATR